MDLNKLKEILVTDKQPIYLFNKGDLIQIEQTAGNIYELISKPVLSSKNYIADYKLIKSRLNSDIGQIYERHPLDSKYMAYKVKHGN